MRITCDDRMGDVRIWIAKDTKGGSYEARVRRAVRFLWSRGIYPGPAAMGVRLHGHSLSSLNGRETRWRNLEMRRLRIPRQRRDLWPLDRPNSAWPVYIRPEEFNARDRAILGSSVLCD